MKINKLFAGSCLLMAGLTACNNDAEFVNETLNSAPELVKGVNITANDFLLENSNTRTAYTVDAEGLKFSWTNGDIIGVYPIGGDQVAFPISSGDGNKTAAFDGGTWALRGNVKYAAYYPFSDDNYKVPMTRLSVSYLGQVQNSNESLDNISKYDYLACAATQPDADGNVNLQMNHLGCFVKIQLTVPVVAYYSTLDIISDKAKFITEGVYNLSDATPAIASTSTYNKMTINLGINTTQANEVITVYAMVAPVDMSSSTLTFKLSDSRANAYSFNTTGKNMEAGYAYSYAGVLTSAPTPMTAVDLGLPSGTKWASCNLGANAPEQEGDYYAWGEVTNAHHWRTDVMPDYKYDENGMPIYDEYGNQLWDPVDWTHLVFMEEDYQYYVPGRGSYTDEDGFYYPEEDPTFEYIGDNISDTQYDVAKSELGGTWKMPTTEDFNELIDYCTLSFVTYKNTRGYKVTGSNGNWIFIAEGRSKYDYWDDSDYNYISFWLASSMGNDYAFAVSTGYTFNSNHGLTYYEILRWHGTQIRPVCK